MKVAFVIGEFPKLSETFILDQITGLVQRGHEVAIFAHQPVGSPKIHPDVAKYELLSRTLYFPGRSKGRLARLAKALGLLMGGRGGSFSDRVRSLNFVKYGSSLDLVFATQTFARGVADFDVVHCHFGPNGLLGVALRDLGMLQGKVVTTFHGADMSKYLKARGTRAYRLLARDGDLFLPISEYWRTKLIRIGFDSEKTLVHHMGVDCQKFEFKPRSRNAHEQVYIISVARLTEKKGIEYGIRAIAKCVQRGQKIQYTIVGDGPQRPSLEALVCELGIQEAVHFAGWQQQDEVAQLLDAAHILMAPSVTAENGDMEGIPVAIMEAMAQGLPVVSTWHSGIPELISNEESGLLVEERDSDALAQALIDLIDNPDQWHTMGQKGRAIVERHYNIHVLNDQLEQIYMTIAEV